MLETFFAAHPVESLVVAGLALGAGLALSCVAGRFCRASWSAKKRQNDDLLRKAALLDTVLENMPLAVFAKDVRDNYKYNLLNKKAQEVFCLKSENTLGRSDYDFFPKAEADFFRATDQSVMEGRKLVEIESEPVTTPNGVFTAHTLKMPVYQNGEPVLLLGILEDVTEKIKTQDELCRAKESAEEANRAKSEFLANMSHELRTPLNSIIGMLRLLNEKKLSAEEKDCVDIAYQSSVNLLDIVNDILDLSKIEAREMRLEKVGMDLEDIIGVVVSSFAQSARERGLSLSFHASEKRIPYVLGDPSRLSRILINLIGNAVKYTEKGAVDVRASFENTDIGHLEFRCEIADTGIGIPPDKLERVFDKFVQADTSTTRKYGGTGLGLAITKQLVELMGGAIDVKSEVGKGSVFGFTVPFEITDALLKVTRAEKSEKILGTLSPARARVLIAEDHPLNQALIGKLMKKFGIGFYEVVDNGREALHRFENDKWDIVLMDCFMPEINGYDTTIRIREIEKISGRHTPIVAMTANAMVGEREKCLACGMDEYISKPISVDETKRILGQWIDFSDSPQT